MHQERIWKKIYEADVFLLPFSRLWQEVQCFSSVRPDCGGHQQEECFSSRISYENATLLFGGAALFTSRRTVEAAALHLMKVLTEILLSQKSKRITF